MLGHHQQDSIGHSGGDLLEESPRQVGAAPFAVAGIDVESEELLPMMRLDIAAHEPLEAEAGAAGGFALLTDHLALAGGERIEEVLKAAVAVVVPVILDAHSSDQPRRRQRLGI